MKETDMKIELRVTVDTEATQEHVRYEVLLATIGQMYECAAQFLEQDLEDAADTGRDHIDALKLAKEYLENLAESTADTLAVEYDSDTSVEVELVVTG
jgi:hypothetical protein